MTILFTLLLSTYLTIFLVPVFSKLAIRLNVVDQPNERKVHVKAVPRVGGFAMALGTLVPILIWAPSNTFFKAIMAGSGIIVFFGVIDDFRGLGSGTKFFGQFIAAMVAISYGDMGITSLGTLLPDTAVIPAYLSIPLTLLFIVGVTNAINLADGLDGLAGGLSLLAFICIAALAYSSGQLHVSLLAVAASGAIFGFLKYNTYPASLFMGDTGSQLLGFLSATLSLSLTQGNTPLCRLLPLILLGFPILDTLTVMLARIARKQHPFKADKTHFHHKLMKLGLHHKDAVVVIYIIQSALVVCAYLFRFSSETPILIGYMMLSGIILSGFVLARNTRWNFKRIDVIDTLIKYKFQGIVESKILIKVSFQIVEIVLPSLLIFTCFIPENVPLFYGLLAGGMLTMILVTWTLNQKWTINITGIALYLFIPCLIYLSETITGPWINREILFVYHLAFWVLAIFIYLTLKYTRRRSGFKTTPMDYLILFIVLATALLPGLQFQSGHIGNLAVKIIIFFMGYEVLVGELRSKFGKLHITTVIMLVVIGLRCFTG